MSILATQNLVAAQESEQPVLRKIEKALERCQLKDNASQDVADLLPKLVSPSGEEIELPQFMFQLLKRIAYESARGSAVGVVFVPRELSISEAADILDVLPSYLVSLLDTGKLPYIQNGVERRILLSDLKEYERHDYEEKLQAIAEIAQICQEEGVYD
jgi:excisionase family DNA binding protein